MMYMGSKRRIKNDILPIILKNRTDKQYYVEPFVGGCNIIDSVTGNRIGNDINFYLISMWQAFQQGWIPPEIVTEEEYRNIKNNKENYPPELVGFVGFQCSFGSKFFGGYARNKNGTNYAMLGRNNLLKQIQNIKGINFYCVKYDELEIPKNSIIYCDPPYKGTTEYKTEKFNHKEFWEWCREKTEEGHRCYISEYIAPDDFECIWKKEITTNFSCDRKEQKTGIEKLFKFKE